MDSENQYRDGLLTPVTTATTNNFKTKDCLACEDIFIYNLKIFVLIKLTDITLFLLF